MIIDKHWQAVLLGCFLAACGPTETVSEPPPPELTEAAPETELQKQANAILTAAYPANGPGAAAIITRENETVFVGAQGLANIESDTPVTPDTVFRLASITKQIAAATLMLLVEDGLIDLDAPIGTYLPEYPSPGADIPVRHMLNHTSGIPSYTGIPGVMLEFSTSREMTTDEMIEIFSGFPLAFEPGSDWAYNNSGYVLVGALIEAVTDQPWSDVMAARIAEPLGLETLRAGIEEADLQAMATGYTGGERPRLSQDIHMSFPHAAGALISNVEDLAAWGNAFHNGEVVSEASYAAMTAPTVLTSGDTQDYGFGLGFGTLRDQTAIGHSGGIFGFSTDSIYLPDTDVFVAVLVNTDSPGAATNTVMRRLAALAIGDPYPVLTKQAPDMARLASFFGVYQSETVTRRFFERDGSLFTFRENGVEAEVFSAGGNRFFYGLNALSWFTLDVDAAGERQMVFYTDDDAEPDILNWTGEMP